MPPARHKAFAAAHRGLSSERVENTVAAFQAAAQAGFQAFELDLRLTRDGEVMVLHDAALERTTNGNGRIAEMRYDEVRGYKSRDGPVPRLDDLFSAMAGWKGAWNLEIKALNSTEPALHLVEHHKLADRVQITSFDPRALEIARDHAPHVPRALIVGGPPDLDDVQAAKETGCAWMNVEHTHLTAAVAKDLQERGFRLGTWTCNDPDKALALVERGVECVITDVRAVREALGDNPAKF